MYSRTKFRLTSYEMRMHGYKKSSWFSDHKKKKKIMEYSSNTIISSYQSKKKLNNATSQTFIT